MLKVFMLIVTLAFMLSCNNNITSKAMDSSSTCISNTTGSNAVYVDINATGNNDGSSWDDAFTELQAGIDAAASKGGTAKVYVAGGTYTPSGYPNGGTGDRAKHFALKNDVEVYGGYCGVASETKTILSGDIGTEGDKSDNVYHIFYHPLGVGLTSSAKLENVTITEGKANGGGIHDFGGGMYNSGSSPTLTSINFTKNEISKYGGGMYNEGNSNPTLTDINFDGNMAEYGGGMYNDNSNPTLTDVNFDGNTATHDGGGMYNYSSSNPTLNNVKFNGNTVESDGGGMVNIDNSNPTLTDVKFNGNIADDDGGGIFNYNNSSPTLNKVDFESNIAGNKGGALYNKENSNSILTDVTFTNNKATGSYGYGGGVYNYNSSSTLTSCTFTNNSATTSGGAMYSDSNSSPVLTDVEDGEGNPLVPTNDAEASKDNGYYKE